MKSSYATTIENAFEHLTIDGVKDLALVHAQSFKAHPDATDQREDWRWPVLETLFQLLVQYRGSLPVSTSGTTGRPKEMKIARQDLVASARLTADTFDLHEGDRILHCLPCKFIAGKMMLVRAMVLGLDMHIVDPRGNILEHLGTRDRFRFTAMIPSQLHRAIQEDRKRLEEQFEMILLGGGPVSMALTEDVRELNVQVFQGYGSTETVTHVAMRRLNGPTRSDRYHAIGKVYFGQDDRGCLIVYTPHLSTRAHITNDMVDIIDDHTFRWRGRFDNVILTGGRKIFPEHLEEKTGGLVPYPHFFMPIPDDRLGQAVALVLETPTEDQNIVQEVMELLVPVLETHELPKRISATRKFARTRTGKIIRRIQA